MVQYIKNNLNIIKIKIKINKLLKKLNLYTFNKYCKLRSGKCLARIN